MFGIQAPKAGDKDKLFEKVAENWPITTNAAPMVTPIAKCRPIPPLTFLEATATPIIVRITMENGSELRWCNCMIKFLGAEIPVSYTHLTLPTTPYV